MGWFNHQSDMGVSENSGTPKSSILIGFSIINHPFLGTSIFGNTHMFPDELKITQLYEAVTMVTVCHMVPAKLCRRGKVADPCIFHIFL